MYNPLKLYEGSVPFAKERGSFNASIEQNLIQFVTALQEKHIVLSSTDFRDFPFETLKSGDMVYCDPPYLITTASYNDGNRGHGGWGVEEDRDLLLFVAEIFALVKSALVNADFPILVPLDIVALVRSAFLNAESNIIV